MRGRKRVHDHPVARTITIEFWLDILMEECKKAGIRPGDIVQAGIMAIFNGENKLPPALYKSFLTHIKPKYESLKDTIEYFEREVQLQEAIPKSREREPEEIGRSPRSRVDTIEAFCAVKLLSAGEFLLLSKKEYEPHASIFELHDDNTDLDWTKLPRFYSVDAVLKYYSQKEPAKEDAPA